MALLNKLTQFIDSHSSIATFVIITPISNYYEDKLGLQAQISDQRKPFNCIITSKLETTKQFRHPAAYVYYDPEFVANKPMLLRNSRRHAVPYVNYVREANYLLGADVIKPIGSYRAMKEMARKIAEHTKTDDITVIQIDATLLPDEFMVAQDLFLQILLQNKSLRWCVCGSSEALRRAINRNYGTLMGYLKLKWTEIIPDMGSFLNIYTSMLGDDVTSKELCQENIAWIEKRNRNYTNNTSGAVILYVPSVHAY